MTDRIRVVASDFDGTILKNGAQQMDGIYVSQIRQLKALGISFIAASGRQYSSLRSLLLPVADEISYICENGAMIACGNKVVYQSEMQRERCMELVRDMRQISGTETVVYSDDCSYVIPEDPAFAVMLREKVKSRVAVPGSYEEIGGPINKISIYWPRKGRDCPGIPEDMARAFHEKYDPFLNVVDGGNGWLDFTNKGVDKGSALRILAQMQGFSLSEVLSFGDSENDITMLKETGISYAMDTAGSEVKASALGECSQVSDILRQLIESGNLAAVCPRE